MGSLSERLDTRRHYSEIHFMSGIPSGPVCRCCPQLLLSASVLGTDPPKPCVPISSLTPSAGNALTLCIHYEIRKYILACIMKYAASYLPNAGTFFLGSSLPLKHWRQLPCFLPLFSGSFCGSSFGYLGSSSPLALSSGLTMSLLLQLGLQ